MNLAILLVCIYRLLCVFSSATQNCNNLKLELVQVLFRHGARTPIRIAWDVYNHTEISAYEPWGFGELNNEGKKQQYELGKFLRKRYNNYLSSIYKSEDVYAFTSERSRTRMSMELVLAGLYPPVGSTMWNKNLIWSPIPYSFVPARLDILLMIYSNPKYLKLIVQQISSTEFRTKLSQYSDFINFVAENAVSGGKGSFIDALLTFDVLNSNEYMNLTLPKWYTPKVKKIFIELMDLVYDSLVATTEMKRLGVGPLIKTFVENMNVNGTTLNPRKIYLYAGHDANVASFVRTHNIQEAFHPVYGSALIFEKIRDNKDQIFVRLLARGGHGKLKTLKLNNKTCCPIDEYLEIVNPTIPSEIEIDDMIGSLNATEIRKLFYDSSVKNETQMVPSLVGREHLEKLFVLH